MKFASALIVLLLALSIASLFGGAAVEAKTFAGVALAILAVVIACHGGFWLALALLYGVFHWTMPQHFPLF